MRIYLDNCCYNRPYDDQGSLRVSLETQSIEFIMDLIKRRRVDLVTSFVLFYENAKNPHELRKRNIESFLLENACENVGVAAKATLQKLATQIMLTGVKVYDAYHVASAIYAQCDYFLTTDARLLKYESAQIVLKNPVDLIPLVENL